MQTGGHPVYMVAPNHVSHSLQTGQQQINKLKEHIGIKPIVDMTRPMSYLELQRQNEDHQQPGYYLTRSAFVADFTDEIQDTLIDAIENGYVGHSFIGVIQCDGRVHDFKTEDTAFPHRRATMWIEIVGVADSQNTVEDAEKWALALKSKVQPYSLGSYINDIELNKSPNEASNFASNLKRLRAVKYRYDPENVFHNNRNITPAAPSELEGTGSSSGAAKVVQQTTELANKLDLNA
jgi:hypothetical protein